MPSSSPEDSPFRAGVLPETQVLLAGQDLLTGLSSRAGLEAQYRLAVARARRSGARFAIGVVQVEVDPTVPVDEVFGHDLVLLEIARKLRAALRDTDVIARIGETRFAFLADEVAAAAPPFIAARLSALLSGASAGRSGAAAAARVGVVPWEREDQTLPALMRAAEAVLASGGVPGELPVKDAANAESFDASGATRPLAEPPAPMARARQIARRALGWTSLAALIALALTAAPPEWRNRWFAVDDFAQRTWGVVQTQWEAGVGRAGAAVLRPAGERP